MFGILGYYCTWENGFHPKYANRIAWAEEHGQGNAWDDATCSPVADALSPWNKNNWRSYRFGFCELQNKDGLLQWAIYDNSLLDDVQKERETMDAIYT